MQKSELRHTAEQNDTYDVAKSVLALCITMVHLILFTRLRTIGQFAFPILRTAVPLFFMFSSYFFFKKLQRTPESEHPYYLKQTILRNILLYLFWLVVLWIPSKQLHGYFTQGFIHGLKMFLWSFFTGSTFSASWFIMALIIGLIVVYWLSRHADNQVILVLGILTYVGCVLITNYGKLHAVQAFFWVPISKWPVLWNPYTSFPVAFLWIGLGKLFAERPNFGYFGSNKQQLKWLGISVLGLYLEQILIIQLHSSFRNDCYFMLVPVCIFIFGWLQHITIHFRGAKFLRAFSTITYCLHLTLNTVLIKTLASHGFVQWSFSASIAKWLFIVCFCALTTTIILYLERIPALRWLKYSH